MKKHYLIFMLLILSFLLANCDNSKVLSSNNDIQNDDIALQKKSTDPYSSIIEPIIEKMLKNKNWIGENTLSEISKRDYIELSKMNSSKFDIQKFKNTGYAIESEDMFWHNGILKQIVIELISPQNDIDIVDNVLNKNMKFGIIFDTDFYSDSPIGTLHINNGKGEISTEEIDLSENFDFPIFMISLENRYLEDTSSLSNTSVASGTYLVLNAIRTNIDREGSSLGNMEFMLYVGSSNGTYSSSTVGYLDFDGTMRNDASGTYVEIPDINKKNTTYTFSNPVALCAVDATNKFLCAIESDYDGRDHVNDNTSPYTDRHIANITGKNVITSSNWTMTNRNWYITRDHDGGDDDIFYDSEVYGINSSCNIATWPSQTKVSTPDIDYWFSLKTY